MCRMAQLRRSRHCRLFSLGALMRRSSGRECHGPAPAFIENDSRLPYHPGSSWRTAGPPPVKERDCPHAHPLPEPAPRVRRHAGRCRPCIRTGPGREPVLCAPLRHRRGALHGVHEGHRHQDQPRGRGRRRHHGAPQGRGLRLPRRRDPAGGCSAPLPRRNGRPVPAHQVEGARRRHPCQPARPPSGGRRHSVVRPLHACPGHRLQQGQGEQGRRRHLRGTRRPEEQGARYASARARIPTT